MRLQDIILVILLIGSIVLVIREIRNSKGFIREAFAQDDFIYGDERYNELRNKKEK